MLKTNSVFWLSALCAGLFLSLITACQQAETVEPTVDDSFVMIDAELVGEVFPAATGSENKRPEINLVEGNESILAGGANLLTIHFEDPQDDAAFVLVSMDGEDGYYRTEIESGATEVDLTMLLDQEIIEDVLNLYFGVEDQRGNVSETYTVPVKRIEAGTGNLQVSLAWDIDNDLDLHLVQPDGEEIYYGNDISGTNGILDVDSNPACWIDGIRNENITYGDDAIVLAGDYIVRVDNYAECLGIGVPSNFSVVAYLEGQLLTPLSGQNPAAGDFQPATYTLGGEGDGVEVMRFNVPRQIGKKEILLVDYGFTARKRKSAQASKKK